MSHRKAYSQGNVPFSWEHKPGVSKTCSLLNNDDNRVHNLSPATPQRAAATIDFLDRKIPLPPCPPPSLGSSQIKSRSASKKGHYWQMAEDPFVVAYKKCTKRVEKNEPKLMPAAAEKKKGAAGWVNNVAGLSVLARSTKIFNFSCTYSCDVRDDHLIMLPPLPKERIWRIKHEHGDEVFRTT